MAIYPNEMVPLQIDLAMWDGTWFGRSAGPGRRRHVGGARESVLSAATARANLALGLTSDGTLAARQLWRAASVVSTGGSLSSLSAPGPGNARTEP